MTPPDQITLCGDTVDRHAHVFDKSDRPRPATKTIETGQGGFSQSPQTIDLFLLKSPDRHDRLPFGPIETIDQSFGEVASLGRYVRLEFNKQHGFHRKGRGDPARLRPSTGRGHRGL